MLPCRKWRMSDLDHNIQVLTASHSPYIRTDLLHPRTLPNRFWIAVSLCCQHSIHITNNEISVQVLFHADKDYTCRSRVDGGKEQEWNPNDNRLRYFRIFVYTMYIHWIILLQVTHPCFIRSFLCKSQSTCFRVAKTLNVKYCSGWEIVPQTRLWARVRELGSLLFPECSVQPPRIRKRTSAAQVLFERLVFTLERIAAGFERAG